MLAVAVILILNNMPTGDWIRGETIVIIGVKGNDLRSRLHACGNSPSFSDTQFEYCKHHSAELQLLQTIHDLALNLNSKGQTDITLLDFNEVFDKMLHHFYCFNWAITASAVVF